jgi:hypothetical protein
MYFLLSRFIYNIIYYCIIYKMGGKNKKKEGVVKNAKAPKKTLKQKKADAAAALKAGSTQKAGAPKQNTVVVKEQKSK